MSVKIVKSEHFNKISKWKPSHQFNASSEEMQYIKNISKCITWSKESFHTYFKRTEKMLLENFRDTINKFYINNIIIPDKWINHTKHQWRMLALIRDFHDYMCGRDQKHCIRTDDCRRFISCVVKGLKHSTFSKPVHRLLCGKNAPRKFVHPQFVKFNSINSY